MWTLVYFLFVAHAQASVQYVDISGQHLEAERPEWFQCSKDKDCVDISFPCAGAAVNKKFARQAAALYSAENAVRDCMIKEPAKKVPFKVFCKAGKCGSQGRNPKMGFS